MATITFHGDLKRFANAPIELEVSNFRELMSGLLTQIPGLRNHMRKGYYKVRLGKSYLTEEQIKTNPVIALDEHSSVHFTPVIVGAGKGVGGIVNIVIGVVLVVASWYVGGAAGWAYFASGAAMIAAGAMTLLSKTPDMNTKLDEGEKKQSTSFSNIRNLTPQGRPIPLLYGKMMTSLVLISQGIETFDDMEEAEKKSPNKGRKLPFFGDKKP